MEYARQLNEALLKGSKYYRLALKKIAKDKKRTLRGLAKKSGMSPSGLSHVLSDKGDTSTGSIFDIMKSLGFGFNIKPK